VEFIVPVKLAVLCGLRSNEERLDFNNFFLDHDTFFLRDIILRRYYYWGRGAARESLTSYFNNLFRPVSGAAVIHCAHHPPLVLHTIEHKAT
jgi:hypothetical protein